MTDALKTEREQLAAYLRAAASNFLKHQSIAAGVVLELDGGDIVAAGAESAIVQLLGQGAQNSAPELTDTFHGDNDQLCGSIKALLDLDAENALVPHGVGGHARALLSAAAIRLSATPAGREAPTEPTGWREFIENIATPYSEPLNSVSGYRDMASRKEAMGELRAKAQALLAAHPVEAIQPTDEPVAYLHQVVSGDGDPDQALSFAPDNFPLSGTLGYRSLSHQPLFLAPVGGALVKNSEPIADLSHLMSTSIRDYPDFTEDVLRLFEPGLARKQAKIIRKAIYDVIDARVRNSIIAAQIACEKAYAVQPTPPEGANK